MVRPHQGLWGYGIFAEKIIRDTEGKISDTGYLKKWGYSTRSLGIRDCTIKGIWDISRES